MSGSLRKQAMTASGSPASFPSMNSTLLPWPRTCILTEAERLKMTFGLQGSTTRSRWISRSIMGFVPEVSALDATVITGDIVGETVIFGVAGTAAGWAVCEGLNSLFHQGWLSSQIKNRRTESAHNHFTYGANAWNFCGQMTRLIWKAVLATTEQIKKMKVRIQSAVRR